VRRQITPYRELAYLFEFFAEFTIALLDERAANQFETLRASKIRLGTMDLKIAAIALVNQALLLSRNLRDFKQVPGLRVEDWLE
jgi:tRNA(fMet)-specific endonuclease VapC